MGSPGPAWDASTNVLVNGTWVKHIYDSVHVERYANGRATAEFRCQSSELPDVALGSWISVYDAGQRIFMGTVAEIRRSSLGHRPFQDHWVQIVADDLWTLLERTMVPALAVDNGPDGMHRWNAGAIVRKLINKWIDPGAMGNLTIEPGASWASLGTMLWTGKSVSEIILDLAERSAYTSFLNAEGDFYFVSPLSVWATFTVGYGEKNYCSMEVVDTYKDSVNDVFQSIAYEADDPIVMSIYASKTFRTWQIHDEPCIEVNHPITDDKMQPRYVGKMVEIRLNGVGMKIAPRGSGEAAAIYFREGSAKLWWDLTQPEPGEKDRLTIVFYELGRNLEPQLNSKDLDLSTPAPDFWHKPSPGKPTQVFFDHPDFIDRSRAYEWGKQYKQMYPGSREMRWTMFSKHVSAAGRTTDLVPGKSILVTPSNPYVEPTLVQISSVTVSDTQSAPQNHQLLYEVSGTTVGRRTSDELMYAAAIAEVTPDPPLPPGAPRAKFHFGWPFDSIDDPSMSVLENHCGPNDVVRLAYAIVTAREAPTTEVSIDIEYKDFMTDQQLADLAASGQAAPDWASIFKEGETLKLPVGRTQMEQPQGLFFNDPKPSALKFRTLVRMVVKAGAGGAYYMVQVAGAEQAYASDLQVPQPAESGTPGVET